MLLLLRCALRAGRAGRAQLLMAGRELISFAQQLEVGVHAAPKFLRADAAQAMLSRQAAAALVWRRRNAVRVRRRSPPARMRGGSRHRSSRAEWPMITPPGHDATFQATPARDEDVATIAMPYFTFAKHA